MFYSVVANRRQPSLYTLYRGGGVLIIMHGRSRMNIDLASLQCRDGARRVFTDEADIACTESEAP